MVKIPHVFGTVAIASVSAVLVFFVLNWFCNNQELEQILTQPSEVERFRRYLGDFRNSSGRQTPPLVVQAEVFASYLNLRQSAKEMETPKNSLR